MYLHNQIFYWQIDRTYKFTELEAFFKVLSNSSLVMKSMPVSSFRSKLSLEAACSSVFISVFNLITNSSLTSIELTTCFHEFSENKSTNFFNNIFQQKMKTNSLWVKQGIFFSQFRAYEKSKQILHNIWQEKFVDSYSENS